MALFYSIIALIIFCLLCLRAKIVFRAIKDWNYFVNRYHIHCRMHYSAEEVHWQAVEENRLTIGEGVLVFLMFWKINPNFFFDFKPDWEEIHDLYLLRNG